LEEISNFLYRVSERPLVKTLRSFSLISSCQNTEPEGRGMMA